MFNILAMLQLDDVLKYGMWFLEMHGQIFVQKEFWQVGQTLIVCMQFEISYTHKCIFDDAY